MLRRFLFSIDALDVLFERRAACRIACVSLLAIDTAWMSFLSRSSGAFTWQMSVQTLDTAVCEAAVVGSVTKSLASTALCWSLVWANSETVDRVVLVGQVTQSYWVLLEAYEKNWIVNGAVDLGDFGSWNFNRFKLIQEDFDSSLVVAEEYEK